MDSKQQVENGKLPDGIYRLTRDIKNPKSDRRMNQQRTFRHREVWKAGTVVILRTAPMHQVRQIGARRGGEFYDYEEGYDLLIEAIEPMPETPCMWIERTYAPSADSILDKLFALGKITMADVEAASVACNVDYDAEENS